MTTLRLSGDELPPYDTAVTRDGTRVGTLTSPTLSPRLGPIALAIVEAPFAVPGTELEVSTGGASIAATVHETHPAYDPEKKRPRA